MANVNVDEIKTVEGLLDDILRDAEYEGKSALDWLEQGLCVDEVTLQLGKEDLLKLISKALLAVIIQEKRTLESKIKSIKIQDMANFAAGAALAKYNFVENLVKTNQEKNKLINFEPVRKKGAEANKVKAETNKAFILKTNGELLAHISWVRKTLDERAKYIANVCVNQKIKMANGRSYSESYIKKLITGK